MSHDGRHSQHSETCPKRARVRNANMPVPAKHPREKADIIIIIIIILSERQTRSPKAIEHTQVRLQPEPGALCTGLQPCQLASAPMKPSRSIPPSYTDIHRYTRSKSSSVFWPGPVSVSSHLQQNALREGTSNGIAIDI